MKCEDIELIDGFVYGSRIPTNVDLCMQGTTYITVVALTGIVCGLVFWIGWNSTV